MPQISMNKPLRVSLLIVSSLFSSALLAATDDDEIEFADETVCPNPRINLPKVLVDAPLGPVEEQETIIEGDQMDAQGNSQMALNGNSQIVQGKRGVFADQITYDMEKYEATATNDVRYYTVNGDELKTESMRLEVDTFIGETGPGEMRIAKREGIVKRKVKQFFEDFSFFAPFSNRGEQEDQAIDDRPVAKTRVYADTIDIEGKDFQRLTNAKLTHCPEGNEDVLVTGKEVELDHASGVGYAKHVSVKFKGVPILYAPRLSFPINDERKSGVLTPSVGSDDNSGTILSVPYYFNLAPNYDATLRGTYMTKRGVLLYGEFRHINENGSAILKGEFLPGDDAFNGEDRYALGLDYLQNYSNGWSTVIDLQDVSDNQYLNDFRNDIKITSTTHLQQKGQLDFSNQRIRTRILASKYKTLDDAFAASKPYDRLPQIDFKVNPWEVSALKLGLNSELVQFEHEDSARIAGTRLNVEPYIQMAYEPIFGYVKSKLSVKHLSYSLDNATGEDSPAVTVSKVIIDSGLFFERDTTYAGTDYLHTLESRMMYVNVGDKDQSAFPDFDTGSGSISSYNYLFREDRFFGGDRIGDDHHIALGVTTRIIDDTSGQEKMSASIGQLYYLDDRTVSLSANDTTLTESKSDIFVEADATLSETFKVNSFLRYDQSEGETSNFNLGLDYYNGPRREASIDYFLTKNSSENIRIGLDWPLSPHLQLGYTQLYSLEDSQSRSSSLKLVYDSCCWAVGLTVNRLLQSDGQYRNSILVTFELDGLGKIQSSAQ